MKYLDYEVTEEQDSIENIFCKELEKRGKTKPMNDQEAMILMHLILEKNKGGGSIDDLYEKLKNESASLSILKDRIENLNRVMSKEALILCSIFCRTPGECVMYANYIAYKMKCNNIETLSIDHLCSDIFPFGFFTDETLKEFWDVQKVRVPSGKSGSDNLLDYPKASVSISK